MTLFAQPVIGEFSDIWTSFSGRRKEFIITGALCSVLGLIFLAYTEEVSTLFSVESRILWISARIWVAFALSFCKVCSQALLIDLFPLEQQYVATAWAARMHTAGAVVGLAFMSLGYCQFGCYDINFSISYKTLCWANAFLIFGCALITVVSVEERILVQTDKRSWFVRILSGLYDVLFAAFHLDRVLSKIFWVQRYSWLAWSLIFVNATVMTVDLFKLEHQTANEFELLWFVLNVALILAIVAFVVLWALPILKLRLLFLWKSCHVVLAAATTGILVAPTYREAVLLCGLISACWSIACWAPYALIAERIHKLPPAKGPSPDEGDPDALEAQIVVWPYTNEPSRAHDEQEGLYLGLHNSAITTSQLVVVLSYYSVNTFSNTDIFSRNVATKMLITSLLFLLIALILVARIDT